MIIDDIKSFSKDIEGNIFFDYEIKNLNWFNIGGNAKLFFKPKSLQELIKFLKIYNKRGKIFLLGAGSNVLFSDDIFDGVVIKLGKRFCNISLINSETIVAGSGVLDKKISKFSEDNNIGGMEFLSCIPGTIGGGIKMNSGCYNQEFKNIILSVQTIDTHGKVVTIPAERIKFHYRGSNLSDELIFLSATLKGYTRDKTLIKKEINELKNEKERTQPSKIKTSGSTFKNPLGKSKMKVWELIKNSVPEDINFGDACISSQHSNFFVNKNNAKSNDMLKLINFVKDQVKKKYKIELELEIKVVD